MPSQSNLIDAASRDVRHAGRALLRSPAFSLIAFATLAIGIGATTAIYTVLDAVALRPLPYRNVDRLVSVLHPATVPGNGESKWGMSAGGYFTFKNENRSFEDLGGYRTGDLVVLNGQAAEEARTAEVTASIFTTLQAHAVIGRLIAPADDRPGTSPVAVLGYDYWQRRFGGDRNVVGTMLQTSDGPFQIIGIAERGLSLPKPGPFASTSDLAGFGVDVWTPLQLNPNGPFYNSHQYSGIGRLKPGVTAEHAQRDLATIMASFSDKLPTAYNPRFFQSFNFRVAVVPLRDEVLGPKLAKALWVLFGAVAVVLFIACANVANLFLVRMEARRRESAIRTALGADRAQMALYYLSESLLLTLSAGAAGLLLAYVGLRAILAIAPTDIPRLATVSLGGTSILFSVAVAAAAGLLFGLIPLGRVTVDVNTLREGGRGLTASPAQRIVRDGLVVGQVALALVLLAAAGLMLRSFANLRSVRAGLNPAGVMTFGTVVPGSEFPTRQSQGAFAQEFEQRVAALPGVSRVGAVSNLPLQDYGSGCTSVGREDRRWTATEKGACVATPSVLPGFFESMHIQVRGRTPRWSDYDLTGKSPTVAVLTQALATHLWPGEDALGKGIAIGDRAKGFYRVIGVIPELRAQGLDQPPTEIVFSADATSDVTWTVAAAKGNPADLMPAIRRIISDLNPRVPLVNPRTMSDVVARSTGRASFAMVLLGLAGSMALLLSAVGIYGVISYLVTQRRAEIGVRMALGARMPQVASLVLGQSMRLAGLGVLIGLAGAIAGMRVIGSLLFEVAPTDPVVLVTTSALLLLIAAAASLAPTRRAALIDPVEAMRRS
jgi:putative ABC transport system permease protein